MRLNLFWFIKENYHRFFENRVLDLSAQCAYYFLLSMFPLLLFAITLLSFLPITPDQLLDAIAKLLPGFTNELIKQNVHEILAVRRTGLLSLGILVTIWSALSGLESLLRSVNFSYGITEQRTFLKSKLTALMLSVTMVLVILSAFVLTIFGNRIEHFALVQNNYFFTDSYRFILNVLILYNAFSVLYLVAPIKIIPYREAVPGALFATLGWYVISLGFSFYVENFGRFSRMYGSLGGIIVLIIWFYLSALILILGGQLNAVLSAARTSSRR